MARQISSLITRVLCIAPIAWLVGCEIAPVNTSTTTYVASTLAYTSALATVSSALDDFEGNVGTSSLGTPACARTYSCTSNQVDVHNTSCVNVERGILTGDAIISFDSINTCYQNSMAQDYGSTATLTKNYQNFSRNDGGLVTNVTSNGGVRATYLNNSGVLRGSLTIFEVDRAIGSNYLFKLTNFPTSLTFQGRRARGTRLLTSGTLSVQEAAEGRTTAMTFSNLNWQTPGCCYPTSGIISATVSGARPGNETLVFSSTCGQVQFTDRNAVVSTVNLFGGCD